MVEQQHTARRAGPRTGLGLLPEGASPKLQAPCGTHDPSVPREAGFRDGPGTNPQGLFRALSLLAADLCAFGLAASVVIGACTTFDRLARALPDGHAWLDGWVSLVVVFFLAHMAVKGHYTVRLPFLTELRQVAFACAFALPLDVALNTIFDGGPFQPEAALCWTLLLPVMLACRTLARVVLARLGVWTVPTLVVGSREAAQRLQAAFASQPSLGYDVSGRVPPGALDALRSPADWQLLLEARGAQFVVVAGPFDEPGAEARLVSSLHRAHIPFGVVPAWGALPATILGPQHFFSHDVALLTYRNSLAQPTQLWLKRVFDVVAAACFVLLTAPVLLLIAAAVRMDGGPALFRHRRLGANGKPFDCLKFRTMRCDGDRILAELLARDPAAAAEWADRRKLRHDPRVTAVGGFLRRTSLDELPQLLNVLRGEMSLVGPRPIVAAEVERYGDHIAYYYDARPGLTGLWQVSGRSDTSYAHRVGLDSWYVRNWSLWHDLVILVKTIPALLLKRGAV